MTLKCLNLTSHIDWEQLVSKVQTLLFYYVHYDPRQHTKCLKKKYFIDLYNLQIDFTCINGFLYDIFIFIKYGYYLMTKKYVCAIFSL